MKTDILKQYVTLRKSLEEERATLQARLKEITAALGGGEVPVAAVRRGPGRPKGTKSKMVDVGAPAAVEETKAPRREYKRSLAARKRMAAAQKARYAKLKAEKAGKAVGEALKPVARRKRRTMTPAALKALAKAREIRLAKLKAAKAKK
jgi:hypothetical protein